MGMTLIALASTALADPAALRRRGAITSPARRRVRRHRATAALTAAVAPQRWPPRPQQPHRRRVRLRRALAVITPMHHRSVAAIAAAAIAAAATRSRVRRQAATSAVVRCYVRC